MRREHSSGFSILIGCLYRMTVWSSRFIGLFQRAKCATMPDKVITILDYIWFYVRNVWLKSLQNLSRIFCVCFPDRIGILGTGDKRRVAIGTRKRNITEEIYPMYNRRCKSSPGLGYIWWEAPALKALYHLISREGNSLVRLFKQSLT